MGNRVVSLRKPGLSSKETGDRRASLDISFLLEVVSLLLRLSEIQPDVLDAAVRRFVTQFTPVDSARPSPRCSDAPRRGAEGGHECPQELCPPSLGVGDQNLFLRLSQVLAIIPVSKSTWWAGVQRGIYPKPIRLSARTVAWQRSDILALTRRLAGPDGGPNPNPADGSETSLRPGGDCR